MRFPTQGIHSPPNEYKKKCNAGFARIKK